MYQLKAVAGNPSLKLYDIQSKSNTPISQFDAHTGNITAVAFQANNRWIMVFKLNKYNHELYYYI